MNVGQINDRLRQSGFPTDALEAYSGQHRHYHTRVHLEEVLKQLGEDVADEELFLAAVYHDAVYDPKASDNEERSADLFATHARKTSLTDTSVKHIRQMILDTKQHVASSEKSAKLIAADLYILSRPLAEQIAHEHQIFREYQFADFKDYRRERIRILQQLNQKGQLDALIAYVEQRRPQIGVFCGSFNPFHKGHYNVLQKAERIFDKVIVAFGQNPDKNERMWKRPQTLAYRQIEEYNGLLTDFVASLGYEVVVIRGLRNSTDFQYEQNQYRYIQELMPDIRIVNIFCDKEFEHISSSGIRTLEKFDKHLNYILP